MEMEGAKDMNSNASNSTAAASAPHNHQQNGVVSSPKPRASQQAIGSGEPKKPRPQLDAAPSCPRCSSKNTKFCYYNNYNLNQPRHFCKECSRYWTQGGSLRLVPIGGGGRRNKRAFDSSSSSAGSNTAATTSAEKHNTINTQLTPKAATTSTVSVSMSSPTTGLLFPNDMSPTLRPTGGSAGLDVAMDEDQQGVLPFAPLPLSDDQAPAELAPRASDTGLLPFSPLFLPDDQALELEAIVRSDTTPKTLEDVLTGGSFDAGGSSSSYDAGLAMNGGGSNGMDMDMSFPLPKMGPSESDTMDDLAAELQWQSYINDDGGYAPEPAAGVEQQEEVAGDPQPQEEGNNKAPRIV